MLINQIHEIPNFTNSMHEKKMKQSNYLFLENICTFSIRKIILLLDILVWSTL